MSDFYQERQHGVRSSVGPNATIKQTFPLKIPPNEHMHCICNYLSDGSVQLKLTDPIRHSQDGDDQATQSSSLDGAPDSIHKYLAKIGERNGHLEYRSEE
ncbi:Hypothetical predicted protein [Pelobates cultripes]|uniref:Uncharacterized protein n=1 Tax=Pelobates cultripes TaxID=61616 RepID=A0AAD1SA03_PELCU|nr:Hypothetical predicted protein [Pelobates cultripes]